MTIPGFAGKVLYVDLTRGRLKAEPLDDRLAETHIGGFGINQGLVSGMDPGMDPLSPESPIVIGTGPFAGTIIPGSSQVMILYKSPLNGAFPVNCGGGNFAAFLKSSGYDHVVITGRSEKAVYLKIEDDSPQLLDGEELWGMDVFGTTDVLRQRHEPCSVLPIGQSGENLVNISVTYIDKGASVGSGGLAAVMGSKRLKAIVAVKGTKGLAIADPRRLNRTVGRILSDVKGYRRRKDLLIGGSMAMTSGWVPEGAVARCSSVLVPYPPDAKEIQRGIYEIHKRSRKKIACISCPMSDKDRVDLPERDFTTYDTAIMSERAIMTTSTAYGYSDSFSFADRYAEALEYLDLLNRYGIDRTYTFRGLADYVITLYEEGVITREETGMELNRKLSTLAKMAKMTAFREGFGDLLADGPVATAARIGGNAREYLRNVVKGQFVTFDPRLGGLGPMQFAQLTFPGRCFPVAGGMGAPTYNPGWPIEGFIKEAKRCGLPEDAVQRVFTGDFCHPGRLAKHAEDFYGLFNMLGQCHRLYISRFHSMELLAELYSALTGIETGPAELKAASGRVWDEWKRMNARAGFDRKHDEPPEIWFTPLKGVDRDYPLMDYYFTRRLDRRDVQGLLDDYYDERGWDPQTGLPASPGI